MVNVTILDPAVHAGIRAASTGRGIGAERHMVGITPREIPQAAMTYPILATKDADSGAFVLGAVLGLDEGENLFREQMVAGDTYLPLQLSREGFWIAQERLAADLDHPRFAIGAEELLFDDAHAPTPFLDGIVSALRELRGGEPLTRAFLDMLTAHRLLAPVEIELSFDDGSRRTLEDLYTIDEAVLRDLDDTTVLDLFRRGYLQLVYLMIASMRHIPTIAKRKNALLGR